MKAVALSTFDSIEGPMVHFFITDGFVAEDKKEEISSFLNFNASKDYFILRIDGLTTYNTHFTIKSRNARGRVEMLMLSLIVDPFPSTKMEAIYLKEALEFVSFLRGEPDAELLFHLDRPRTDEELEQTARVYEGTFERLHAILDKVK